MVGWGLGRKDACAVAIAWLSSGCLAPAFLAAPGLAVKAGADRPSYAARVEHVTGSRSKVAGAWGLGIPVWGEPTHGLGTMMGSDLSFGLGNGSYYVYSSLEAGVAWASRPLLLGATLGLGYGGTERGGLNISPRAHLAWRSRWHELRASLATGWRVRNEEPDEPVARGALWTNMSGLDLTLSLGGGAWTPQLGVVVRDWDERASATVFVGVATHPRRGR